MIIDGQDATKVARRQYGQMITALYAEPFGNGVWAGNVVNAWQKLDTSNPLRGILEARIVYGLPLIRIAEIYHMFVGDIADAIGSFLKGVHRGYDENRDEELFPLW